MPTIWGEVFLTILEVLWVMTVMLLSQNTQMFLEMQGFVPVKASVGQEAFKAPPRQRWVNTGHMPTQVQETGALRYPFASKSVTLQLCSPAHCPKRTTAGTVETFPIP